MKTIIITEKDFIEFVYAAPFSRKILLSFLEVAEQEKGAENLLSFQEYQVNQVVNLADIVGSIETRSPQYAGCPWSNIVVEDGYLKEGIEPLFIQMLNKIQQIGSHEFGNDITLFKLDGFYYIKSGHKRIALARYLYEMLEMPAYLMGVNIINCDYPTH